MKIVSRIRNNTYGPFLKWLLFNTAAVVGAIATYHFGLLPLVYENDSTYITWFVTALYVFSAAYCGMRCWYLSKQKKKLEAFIEAYNRDPEQTISVAINTDSIGSVVVNHVRDVYKSEKDDQTVLLNCRANELHDKHEIFWRMADAFVTLGLWGTVLGFVMALWPFFTMDQFTFEAVKGVLGTVSGGIAVALFTIVVGIATNLLLKHQAHQLEVDSNAFVTKLAHITETEVIPYFKKYSV